jgi:hypothetical protein
MTLEGRHFLRGSVLFQRPKSSVFAAYPLLSMKMLNENLCIPVVCVVVLGFVDPVVAPELELAATVVALELTLVDPVVAAELALVKLLVILLLVAIAEEE